MKSGLTTGFLYAHGVPQKTEGFSGEQEAQLFGTRLCPRVKSSIIHCLRHEQGSKPFAFGESEHPEVRGLVSYAHGMSHIFSNESEIDSIELLPDSSYVLASQTTQDREAFAAIMESAFKTIAARCFTDYLRCHQKRQEEARRIARMVEAMVVVGGKQSGNTRRLAHLAAQAGIDTFHR